ncbi:MAG: hypothetical protein ABEJ85_02100 [Haloarculaceae archaeon]
MADLLTLLDPHEAVLPVIALIGLVPVVLQYRDQSRWFVVGYLPLIVATLGPNLQALSSNVAFTYAEHAVGLLGSGVAFLVAAYVRRDRVAAGESGATASLGRASRRATALAD